MSIATARRSLAVVAALAVGGLVVAAPSPAHAWWRGGVFVGVAPFPFFVAPPVYYAPPPVYYAPPPGYVQGGYAPGPAVAQGGPPGQTCYAGPYVCPLDRSVPLGSNCSCPGNTGRVFGTAR